MTWLAAWVGALLGVLNFVIALLARRPVFAADCRVVASEAEAQLRIANIGETPLLIRRVCIWPAGIIPSDHADPDTERTGVKRAFSALEKGRFLKIIQPGKIGSITLLGLSRGNWCLVLI